MYLYKQHIIVKRSYAIYYAHLPFFNNRKNEQNYILCSCDLRELRSVRFQLKKKNNTLTNQGSVTALTPNISVNYCTSLEPFQCLGLCYRVEYLTRK